MASKFYGAISHIGGADGDLDAISAVVLTDGDGAVVLDAVNDTLSMYTLVGTSSEVNDAVNFTWVKPTDAATPGKRWKQVEILTANLDVSGTLASVDADFSGDVTADTLELGGAGVVATDILDENDMASDSATALASQQSIKAYVDTQLTAEDLDVIGDTGGAISIDLDSETLTLAGGTGIASVSGTNTVTFNIDSTVATLTGSQVLTNKTLTSPVLNTGVSGTAVSTDDTLAADSDTLLPSQSAVKGYVDSATAAVESIPAGTKMFFAQATAPTGWTTDTSFKDNVLACKADSGVYSVVGANKGTFTISVANLPSHNHSGSTGTGTAAATSHTHTFAGATPQYGSSGSDGGYGTALSGSYTNLGAVSIAAEAAHTHTVSTTVTVASQGGSDGLYRPKATVGIIATKD